MTALRDIIPLLRRPELAQEAGEKERSCCARHGILRLVLKGPAVGYDEPLQLVDRRVEGAHCGPVRGKGLQSHSLKRSADKRLEQSDDSGVEAHAVEEPAH